MGVRSVRASFDGFQRPAILIGHSSRCLERCAGMGDPDCHGAIPQPVHVARKRSTGIEGTRKIANQGVERCTAGALAPLLVDEEGGLRSRHLASHLLDDIANNVEEWSIASFEAICTCPKTTIRCG